ncbi:endo-beta-N-acetylglucosaminidase [Kribbella sp. GL6]|uniref:endo-beta-N-acetylglucosaminidase n=1 Tax=Kribbella sp. GL6 TaxID=3419765 RepID=UPI003CFD11D1
MSDPVKVSRRTLITVGGAGLAAALAGVGGTAQADAAGVGDTAEAAGAGGTAEAAGAAGAAVPKPGSGGIPPGPSTFGWDPADLLAFDPATHPWGRHLRCLVPLAPRIAPFAPTQAHPDLDPGVRLSTLSLDDAGTVYEGRNQPIGLEGHTYTQRFWPYIDVWGTWHGQVLPSVPSDVVANPSAPGRTYGVIDIPNPGWTEAAHKNGVKTIGGWFWPRSGVDFGEFLVQAADGSFPVGDKLIEIRRYFGFDGLFINQEATITAAQAGKLRDLFRYIKAHDPGFYLQYYDADLPNGDLDYQNTLNVKNVPWLGAPGDQTVDSIFVNYGWPYVDPDLSGSAKTAAGAGFDPRAVAFAGVEHQQGGFNPEECFTDYAYPGHPGPVSVGLFVEDQYWANAAWSGETSTVAGRAKYRDLEQRFWSGPTGNPATSGRLEPRKPPYRTDVLNYKKWDGIAHGIVERSPYGELPIVTTFNVGVGSRFSLDGTQVRDGGWDNQGCADRSLTWQYWTDGVTVTLDESTAYEGAHSLAVSGTGVLHLFKTDLTQAAATEVRVVAQGLSTLELGVTRRTTPGSVEWTRLTAARRSAGWTEYRGRIPRADDRIARISLRTSGSGHLGKVFLADTRTADVAPGRPRSFTVADAGPGPGAGSTRHLTFAWRLQPDAAAYDVLQNGRWLGRVHRDVFFAESVDLTNGRTFELVPIGANGNRGPALRSTL